MNIFLYNHSSQTKELFTPIDSNNITLYVCGPTVYDYIHIGNARAIVAFDVLYRTLKLYYKNVTYARNITDIDDKIMNAANQKNISIQDLTKQMTSQFHEDIAKMHVLAPDHEPKATDYIEGIISLITKLINKNYAYEKNNHIYFDTTHPQYGSLNKLEKKQLLQGVRISVNEDKKNANDFILWKPSSAEQPGWNSPWGRGRPGWHSECCAMVNHIFGNHIDIHGGGLDLKFPHHENEQIQSLVANDNHTFANFWLYNGFVTIEGNKMSKSEGNFITLNELLKKHSGEAIKLSILRTHYRKPFDFQIESVKQANNILNKLYTRLAEHKINLNKIELESTLSDSIAPLLDDLNAPQAIADLQSLINNLNAENSTSASYVQRIKQLAYGLGLMHNESRNANNQANNNSISPDEIEAIIKERNQARLNGDYAKSDAMRDKLLNLGVVILDNKDKTTSWKYK